MRRYDVEKSDVTKVIRNNRDVVFSYAPTMNLYGLKPTNESASNMVMWGSWPIEHRPLVCSRPNERSVETMLKFSEKSSDNHFGKNIYGKQWTTVSDFRNKLLILKRLKMHQRYAKTNQRLVLDGDNLLIRYFISPIVFFFFKGSSFLPTIPVEEESVPVASV